MTVSKRKRAIIGVLIAAIGVFAALILIFGALLVPQLGAPPPLALQVVPAGLSSGSPPAPPSTCILPATSEESPQYTAVGESQVLVSLHVSSGTNVTGATIELLAWQAVPESVYATCASTLPHYAGTPSGWQIVRLPVRGSTVPIYGLRPDRTLELIVQPPLGRTFVPVYYLWQINVTYRVGSESGTWPSDLFATVAPPA